MRAIKRSLSVARTTSHASLHITSRLLDVEGLWSKTLLSYAHRLHRRPDLPSSILFQEEIEKSAAIKSKKKQPSLYTLSFAHHLDEVQDSFQLHYDQHFSSLQLKQAAASDLLSRMVDKKPKSPFMKFFDIESISLTRVDHCFRSDPPAIIALRSRLRMDWALLNHPLFIRRMISSDTCPHCPASETIEHVLLDCPQYNAARTEFYKSFSHKPTNDRLVAICFGCTDDSKQAGHHRTLYEKISGHFLLEIARLRPSL